MDLYLKIAGGVLVIISTTGVGFLMADDVSEHLRNLITLKNIIINLKGEIRYNQCILSDALRITGNRTDSQYKHFLINAAQRLENEGTINAEEIWKECVDKYVKDKLILSNKEILNLKQLGSNLGYLDMELQMTAIDFYMENLQRGIEEAAKERDKKMKLYRTLGVMAGIFAVIIMV